jgi:cytochrome c-type biogenesis protein CcmE
MKMWFATIFQIKIASSAQMYTYNLDDSIDMFYFCKKLLGDNI